MKTLKRRANAIPLPVGNEDTQLRKHGHDQLLERISAATAARVVPAADAKAWCGYLVVEGWEDRRISGLDFAASLHLPTVPSPAASSFAQPQTLYPRRLVSFCAVANPQVYRTPSASRTCKHESFPLASATAEPPHT